MTNKLFIAALLAFAAFFASCEKDITIDLPLPEERLVVEGRVMSGNFPYLFLTRNGSFFSGNAQGLLENLFVHDAEVYVEVDGQRYLMPEYCLSTLPAHLRPMVMAFLGLEESEVPPFDICAYFTLDVTGEFGKTYKLEVTHSSHHLTAVTTIPNMIPMDSLWFVPEPDNDSIGRLWLRMKDPDTLGNFYRYFTKRNSEAFYPGYFGSVWDDRLLNGQTVSSPIDRGYAPETEFDWSTYGRFEKGDTIVLNVNMIDRAGFDFWNTYEEQKRSGGPFASPTYIRSNINGGLGIWGGYGAVFDTLVVAR